tara:strand:+ start:1579 stop:2010 length:432 start_codon:yes stop_codon:yes gene_type:complete
MNETSLIESYNFYKQYHNHPINKGLHMICIPMIVWSLLAMIKKCRRSNTVPKIIYYLYILYYFKLNFYYGIYSFFFFKFILNSALKTRYNMSTLVKIHFSSWILQFVGHYIEGKKPALLDGIFQAFTIAPYFTVIEILSIFSL